MELNLEDLCVGHLTGEQIVIVIIIIIFHSSIIQRELLGR